MGSRSLWETITGTPSKEDVQKRREAAKQQPTRPERNKTPSHADPVTGKQRSIDDIINDMS